MKNVGPSANALVRPISSYVQDPLYYSAAEEILRGYRRLAEPFDWIYGKVHLMVSSATLQDNRLGPRTVRSIRSPELRES